MTRGGTARSVARESIPADQGDLVPNTIVIGSDGSAQAEAALRFGGTLARALGARVVVVSAYVHTPPLRGDIGAYELIMRDDADEIARRGAAAIQGVSDVKALVSSGATLAEALHRAAQAELADLLVVATSARRRIAGHQPGSMSERVMHHSPCPVAVVPPQESEPRFTRIGVAVDGTPAARAALEFAFRLGERAGRDAPTFELLHVTPAPEHVPQPGLSYPPARLLDPEQLETIAAETAAHGELEVNEQMGDPAKELVRMSEGLDVLITGSRDQGAVKRLLLGSVSTHVVHNATCPVIVVPAFAAGSLAGYSARVERTSA
jgi:nucleotide-binding universal stress UspA family protein